MSKGVFSVKDGPNVYAMPAGAPFLDHLAEQLSRGLGSKLHTALILLPTRRAVRELGEAFVRLGAANGGAQATLLPMMRPLADIDPDEPPFEPGDLAHQITPAIDSVKRRFALSRLVLQKEKSLRGLAPDPAAALALTEPLLSLLNDSFMEALTSENLEKLKPIAALSAEHYQQAAVFYEIVATHWPQYLADNNVMDPMQRRVALLTALGDLWEESPPQNPVIIAGSTGTLAATARLISIVSRLPEGLIVLPGLDMNIDDKDVWEKSGDEHPQGALRRLLGTIGIDRSGVSIFPGTDTVARSARRRLIAEAMIPADATAGWLERTARIRESAPKGADAQMQDPIELGLEGLSLIETKTLDEEASVCALIFRETLSHKGRTAALVTPDPELGRRVAAKMTRWDVTVDVSAGQPLEETPAGTYLSLILTLADDPWDPVAMAALFKHKLTALGRKPGQARKIWQRIEQAGFRGPRPQSFEDLKRRYHIERGDFNDGIALIKALHAALKPLSDLKQAETPPQDLARLHAHIGEAIAAQADEAGATFLWRGNDGDAGAKLISDLLAHGEILDAVTLEGYARLLAGLMRGRVVRPNFGTHPRLQILGPLEARLLSVDTLILGGLNEGVWPALPTIDPLLSYAMRETIGLTSPERRIGLAAHDFAQLACSSHVVLTRAARTDDGPAVASRWIWRLTTLLRGALGDDQAKVSLRPKMDYLALARQLDSVHPDDVTPATEPMPRPPVARRWPKGRKLSVTQIETWTRDPYTIFARKVLGLEGLDELDQALGPREYGSAVHKALENFMREFPSSQYKKSLPVKAASWLEAALTQELLAVGFAPEILAREGIRLSRLSRWFTQWEQTRRDQGWVNKAIEVKGDWTLHPGGSQPFRLTGEADRIDLGPEGYAILDYKTGTLPSASQVAAGFNSQLPLEAAMLEAGAYDIELPPADIADLTYVRVQGKKDLGQDRSAVAKDHTASGLAAAAYEGLLAFIAHYDNPETPYRSQPRALSQNQNNYGDFDHLARRAEWASTGDDDGGRNDG